MLSAVSPVRALVEALRKRRAAHVLRRGLQLLRIPLSLLFSCLCALGASKEDQRSSMPREWSPNDYGAVADGSTLDTAAFQRALDLASDAGGGTVRVKPGNYAIGTIRLYSGTTLRLEKGATLLGSEKIADYQRGYWPALILVQGQEQVAIEGEGTIDGRGKQLAADTVRLFESDNLLAFFPNLRPNERVFTGNYAGTDRWIVPHAMEQEGTLRARISPKARSNRTWRVSEFVRPQLLEFSHCRNVRVTGVRLKNAANWVQTYRECDDVTITGIQVDSTSYWNNDGLDIVNCRNVQISDCEINAADDGICLKSEPSDTARTCENIEITRCRIRSSASAFKLGTASFHGFRHIRVSDLEIRDTFRSAIALESVDGARLEDVQVQRIRAINTGNAIFLRLGQRNLRSAPGVLRDIVLSDIHVSVPSTKPDVGYEHEGPEPDGVTNLLPASIVGLPDRPIENVLLRNISIEFGGEGQRDRAEIPLSKLTSIPERRGDYPEFSMFGELPAWGFFIRHAAGIRVENVSLRLAKPDYRSAIVVDDVREIALRNLAVLNLGEEPAMTLSRTAKAHLENVSWPEGAAARVLTLQHE